MEVVVQVVEVVELVEVLVEVKVAAVGVAGGVGVFMAGPVCVVVSRVLLGPARPPTAVSSLPPPRPCTLHDPLQSDINPHPYSKLYQGERGLSTRS